MKFSLSQNGKYIALAAIALVLGWQLGVRQEQSRETERFGISIPSHTATGTGTVLVDPEREANISLIWTVWRLLLQSYIAPQDMDSHKMVMSAVEGLVRGVGDPYTTFLPPQEAKSFSQSLNGSLEGIGAELNAKDNEILVIAPIKGSPAEKAGLKKGDLIIAVNGESTDGWTLGQVVEKVRGPKGTTVTLKVYRAGENKPLVIPIVRDTIQIPSIASDVLKTGSGTIAYIIMTQFGDDTVNELRTAVQDTIRQNPKGMIIDLRDNGGGYLDGAVSTVSMFQKTGKVVSIDKRGEALDVKEVNGSPIAPTIPLVVLINENSASASEIVAGALQDNHRAVIVGMKSFGKGTVQEVHELPDGSILKVTVAHWITPGGRNLAKDGVHPDVVQDLSSTDVEAKKDSQLEAAKIALFTYKWIDGVVTK